MQGHAGDPKLDEGRGADIGDTTELRFPGPDLHHGIELAIDREDAIVLADFRVLEEENRSGKPRRIGKSCSAPSITKAPDMPPSICFATTPCACG
jgi:hypothetical protein